MFGIWRHRRRQATEDRLAAYVDIALAGGADAHAAALRDLPGGLHREAEELRLTAAMMRSVDSVRAPRSFALTAFPAEASERERPRWSFLAPHAPALAAAAAAVALAVLVSGDLGGWLNQGGERSAGAVPASAAPESAFASPVGTTVPPAARSAPDVAEAQAPPTGAAESLEAPAAAAPRAPEEPLPGGALAAPAPPQAAAPAPPSAGEDTATPALAPAAPAPPQAAAPAPPSAGDVASPSTAEDAAMPALAPAVSPEEPSPASELAQGLEKADGGIAGEPSLAGPMEPERAVGGGQTPARPNAAADGGGFSLPLRQLEIAFGVLAAALGGLALLRARRR